jgi:hypothetical protein
MPTCNYVPQYKVATSLTWRSPGREDRKAVTSGTAASGSLGRQCPASLFLVVLCMPAQQGTTEAALELIEPVILSQQVWCVLGALRPML